MKLDVRVTPRAKRDEVLGPNPAGALRVKVTAPAEDGRANRAVVELLADHFNVAKSSVTIVKGERSRNKTLSIGR